MRPNFAHKKVRDIYLVAHAAHSCPRCPHWLPNSLIMFFLYFLYNTIYLKKNVGKKAKRGQNCGRLGRRGQTRAKRGQNAGSILGHFGQYKRVKINTLQKCGQTWAAWARKRALARIKIKIRLGHCRKVVNLLIIKQNYLFEVLH